MIFFCCVCKCNQPDNEKSKSNVNVYRLMFVSVEMLGQINCFVWIVKSDPTSLALNTYVATEQL